MRIPIWLKMFLLVAVILAPAIGYLIINIRTVVFEDKTVFVREYADRFTGAVSSLTEESLKAHRNEIATFVSTRESLTSISSGQEVNTALFERMPRALAVALVDKRSGQWQPVWIEKNKSKTSKWQDGYERTLIKSLNYDAASNSGMFLTKLSQPDGQSAFAFSYLANIQVGGESGQSKALLIGIYKMDAFNSLLDVFKAGVTSVIIADVFGSVYADSGNSGVSTLQNEPLFQEVKTGSKGSVGEYLDSTGAPIIGSFRSVPGTNLYVVSTTPKSAAFQAAEQLIKGLMVAGIGIVLAGLVISIFVSRRITSPLYKLKAIAAQIGAGEFNTPISVDSNDEVGELAKSIDQMKVSLLERDEKIEHSKMALVQSEKMSAFGQLSAGIAHEVKNPLAGILGHAQLAKSKVTDPEIKKHLEVIEKETRRTKEIVENLMKFARAEKAELQPTDLTETVSGACDLVDHQLTLMGVKISKHLKPVPKVNANSNQLQQVLLNLMMNAGHAMEKAPTKELRAELEHKGDVVQIRIRDTGHGMPPEVQKRLFEPFFTTKPAGKGTGLGLSVSFGIVRDHNGKIYVESAAGKGTTFFIDIPVLKAGANVAAAPATQVAQAQPSPVAPIPPPPTHEDDAYVSKSVPSVTLAAQTITKTAPVVPKPAPASPSPAAATTSVTKSFTNSMPSAPIPQSPFAATKVSNNTSASSVATSPAPKSLGGKEPLAGDVGPSLPKENPVPPPIKTPAKSDTTFTDIEPIESSFEVAKRPPESVRSPVATGVGGAISAKPISKSEPPAPPTEEEFGYTPPPPKDDGDFKVSIRRPKLKV